MDCTAAHCPCGALIRLYKEDLGRSLDAAELKDMLKSAFDWYVNKRDSFHSQQ